MNPDETFRYLMKWNKLSPAWGAVSAYLLQNADEILCEHDLYVHIYIPSL